MSAESVERVGREIMDAQGQWEKENNRSGSQLPWTKPHVDLLARIAINAMQEADIWRSMESAPRDGTSILAYNPMVGIYHTAWTTRWTGEPGEYQAGTYGGFPCGFWPGGVDGFPFGKWDCQPCAWRPMVEEPPFELRHHAKPVKESRKVLRRLRGLGPSAPDTADR